VKTYTVLKIYLFDKLLRCEYFHVLSPVSLAVKYLRRGAIALRSSKTARLTSQEGRAEGFQNYFEVSG
jgi:abortive infection bacteriophage resistance protein